MKSEFKIDGVPIKRPSSFKISRYRLTKAGRLASGLMTMDLVAKKRKFFFTYDVIRSDELNVILDLLWKPRECFYTLTYVENNEIKEAVVYAGEIPTELYRTGGIWVWRNVNFDLIEQ